MAVLENVFSWSKSRDEQFRECQRKYYYDKYVSWGGWDRGAPQENRLAYILKNLKNRWAWKGETVHHVIEHALKHLRSGHPFPLEKALEHLTEVMRRDFRSSKTKKYLEDPKKSMGLFEHEYQKSVSDTTWKTIHDEAAQCVKNFYHSALFGELLGENKENWLVIEDLEEFNLEGVKIYVKLDFARKNGDAIEIYDWKTGKTDKEASVQIGAYAIYAMQKWKVGLDSIHAYLFNLSTEKPVPKKQTLSESLIQETRSFIAASARQMKTLLEDPAKNIPKSRENFQFTPREEICGFCNFYKMCEKYAKK